MWAECEVCERPIQVQRQGAAGRLERTSPTKPLFGPSQLQPGTESGCHICRRAVRGPTSFGDRVISSRRGAPLAPRRHTGKARVSHTAQPPACNVTLWVSYGALGSAGDTGNLQPRDEDQIFLETKSPDPVRTFF